MAFIDSKTFDIYSEIECVSEIYSRSFVCDDLIAPIISMLNIKGYKTKACCSGHPYPGKNYVYGISGETTFVPTYSIEEVTEDNLKIEDEEMKQFVLSKFSKGEKVYRHLVGTIPYEAYIFFEKAYFSEDTELPLGWYLEGKVLRYSFDPKLEPYYFLTNQIAVYMTLYEWVRKLPYRSKVNQEEWMD